MAVNKYCQWQVISLVELVLRDWQKILDTI